MFDTYKRQFLLLYSQFKAAYPTYKLEQIRNLSTDATSNFLNVERNLNNLFKDMTLAEAKNDSKIRKINAQLKKYDAEISLYKKELKREKRKLDAIIQRSSAGEQFKEQYDAVKESTNQSFYYDAFGVIGVAYLTYLVATNSNSVTTAAYHH